jgi:hypothetical protein
MINCLQKNITSTITMEADCIVLVNLMNKYAVFLVYHYFNNHTNAII